tara:strand:- start:93 stop:764 length:672 start_codon:yes stop_codon:yes gene_type:complete
MFKYWKYWLSAIVIVLLHVFSEGVPVDSAVSYGMALPLVLGGIAAGAALTDLLIKAIPGKKEKALRKRLEQRAGKESTGLSQAQRTGMMTEALKGIRGQEASAEADLRRQAAAAGGFGRSGRVQQAMGQQGQARKEYMAQVGADIQKASQAKLQAEEAARIAAEQQLAANIAGQQAAVTQAAGNVVGAGASLASTAADVKADKMREQRLERQFAYKNPGYEVG